jgi:LacI family transcriptional regulator
MTVSNVVNRRGKTSVATTAAVERAIAQLGYVPSVAARQLVGTRGTRVGLIYGDHRTPLLDAVLIGTLQATAARGLQLLIRGGSTATCEEAERLARELIASGAEALLLVPPYAELLSGTDLIAECGIPTAAIATGQRLPDMTTLRIDNRSAMRELTELVLDKGHRRVGFVAGPFSNGDSAERVRGFRDALDARGIAFDNEMMLEGRFTFDSGLAAARALLSSPARPTAIIASNDDMAAGVIAEANRRGLQLPKDLAVTGFDDTSLAARLWPPLTVIRQPIGEMAYRATALLIDAIAAKIPHAPISDEVFPYVLVERESTAGKA